MTLVYFIIALGVLVTVHEWGHFFLARRRGMKVEEFAIGFGPKLFGRRHGETEYKICLIPLGGYVKILGQDPHDPGAADPRSFVRQSVWARLQVVLAGPTMNILLCLVVMPFVFWIGPLEPAFFDDPATIDQIRSGSSAHELDLKKGDAIVKVDGQAINTWRDYEERLAMAGEGPIQLEIRRGAQILKYQAMPAMSRGSRSGGYLGVEPYLFLAGPAVIGHVIESEPALKAGVRVGDEVIAVNGEAVHGWTELADLIHQSGGKPMVLLINRGGERLLLTVAADYNKSYARWVIGIRPGETLEKVPMERHRYGMIDGLRRGGEEVMRMMRLMGEVLSRLFTFQLSYKSLGGPIQIAQASAMAAANGVADFLQFLAFLSLNLGILNLLPIPVLDGGHVVLLGVEALRRKPLSVRFQAVVQQVGVVMLVSLLLLVTWNDLQNVFHFSDFVSKWLK